MEEILYSFIVWSPEGPPYVIRYEPDDKEFKRIDPPFGMYVKGKGGRGRRSTQKWKKAVPPPPLTATRHFTTSADGTRVPWLLVHQKGVKKVRGLIGYVYSAYGSETVVYWPHMKWSPLLRRGWAIAYCFARGGGDNGAEWTDAGQRENHVRTIEDFEATVRTAQKVTGLGPKETVIYGRSAGGMMMGIMTQRHRDGDLMGAVYTEVPFVDTLWTQTNYDVPLTPSGMSEYGNPTKSMRDFAAMMKLSPMYQLDADGAPGVFVLCRTGLKDQQVFASEPFKWVQRLRGAGIRPPAGKYLAFEKDEAHVYGKKSTEARATDLAILEAWLQNKIEGSDIKMTNMQRKKQQQQKKKQQEGGRRRRTVRHRRAARKTRRHARK
jgi:protease II